MYKYPFDSIKSSVKSMPTLNHTLAGPAQAVIKWSGHGFTGLTSDVIAVILLACPIDKSGQTASAGPA